MGNTQGKFANFMKKFLAIVKKINFSKTSKFKIELKNGEIIYLSWEILTTTFPGCARTYRFSGRNVHLDDTFWNSESNRKKLEDFYKNDKNVIVI